MACSLAKEEGLLGGSAQGTLDFPLLTHQPMPSRQTRSCSGKLFASWKMAMKNGMTNHYRSGGIDPGLMLDPQEGPRELLVLHQV